MDDWVCGTECHLPVHSAVLKQGELHDTQCVMHANTIAHITRLVAPFNEGGSPCS